MSSAHTPTTIPLPSIEDTTILGEGKSEANWRYEIQYGPEGEDHYAWIYKDGQFIATMNTWHAREIVEAMNALPTPPINPPVPEGEK